jgi:hypothetical protein
VKTCVLSITIVPTGTADGGKIILVDLVPGHSTTRIVERSGDRPTAPA